MKIALVIKEYSLRKGGAERYAVEVGEALLAAGHEVHVFATRWDAGSHDGLEGRSGDTAPRFHEVPALPFPAPLRLLSFHWSVRRALKRRGFDLVLGFAQFFPQQVYVLLEPPCRYWLKRRHPNFFIRMIRFLFRPVFFANDYLEKKIFQEGNFRLLLCNSGLCKAQALELYPRAAGRVEVLHNGIALEEVSSGSRGSWREEERARLGLLPGETLILFAAMNFKRKGLRELLEGLALLQGKSFRLVVAGRGNTRPYRRFAAKAGLADRVIFLGHVSDMKKLFSAGDLFVLPTRGDSFANSCLEAMAFGLPVVTTALNGFAEAVRDGENGYVVDSPGDAPSLARKIALFIDAGEQERRAMVDQARQTASGFSMENFRSRLFQVVEKMARLEPNPGPEAGSGVLVNAKFEKLLRDHGLLSVGAVMSFDRQERVVKKSASRSVCRINLSNGGKEHVFFLKRHDLKSFPGRRAPSPGVEEWRHLRLFQELGIPTAEPVAAGERILSPRRMQSFLITEALQDYQSLEEFAPRRFAALKPAQRCGLIGELALLTRKMHDFNFSHKDFYFGDIFVKNGEGGNEKPDFKIIDLERLHRPRWFKNRWRIKDLAALNFSAPPGLVSRAERLRFYKIYRGLPPGGKIGRRDRKWIALILAKTRRMARHLDKRRRRQLYR
ncbi:MAG: glycosyltransferase [Planctomycetes bacterium]|nr:glycosyltransferase [Planctomycetota bacterium]